MRIAVCTDVGRKRTANQDNFYINGRVNKKAKKYMLRSFFHRRREQFFSVCDGMGGENCGETAAYLAVKTLVQKHKKNKKLPLSFNERIFDYVFCANEAICRYRRKHNNIRMGSTIAVLYVNPEKQEATAANVGDSKVFLLRKHQLCKLTKDHNQAQRLVNFGIISEDEARTHKDKSKLTQHLGIYPEELLIEPYISDSIPLEKNDIFLICSDGLNDMLSNDDITEILSQKGKPKRLAKRLVKQAVQNGGTDNITVILVQIT